jgi:hypothetical protein
MTDYLAADELRELKLSTQYSLGAKGGLVVSQTELKPDDPYRLEEFFDREDWPQLILHGLVYEAQLTGNIKRLKAWGRGNARFTVERLSGGKSTPGIPNLDKIVEDSSVRPLILPEGSLNKVENGSSYKFEVKSMSGDSVLYPIITAQGDLAYVDKSHPDNIHLLFKYDNDPMQDRTMDLAREAMKSLGSIVGERGKIHNLFELFPTNNYRTKLKRPS